MRLSRRGLLGKALALAGGAAVGAQLATVPASLSPPAFATVGDGTPELSYVPVGAAVLPPAITAAQLRALLDPRPASWLMVGEAGPETPLLPFRWGEPVGERVKTTYRLARYADQFNAPPANVMDLPESALW